jgi:hypothetical protein
VNLPEPPFGFGGIFGELGRLDRDRAPGDRPVAEHVAHPVPEAVAEIGDHLVRGVAVAAIIAAEFEQRDVGGRIAEDVVADRIHRTIEPGGPRVIV